MATEISVSVRNLVEHVFSSGSIDARFRSRTTLLDGTKLHQKIQKTYGEHDQKEVYLRMEFELDGLVFVVDGRCDGLLERNGEIIVDEIKSYSTTRDEGDIKGEPVHWAQAKMYAYMYMAEHGLEEITVQLTYVHTETEEIHHLKKSFSQIALKAFVAEVLLAYAPYAKLLYGHRQKRNHSIKALKFPFQFYRLGQRKLAGAVYKTIEDNRNLFVKAPTGIGKTISTLFPTVKAIGEGKLSKIFYLTAKTITRTTAEEAFTKMRSVGLDMTTVTITAKDKVCFKEETKCVKDYCQYANGYYDRINGALLDILSTEKNLTRSVIEAYAKKHTVCPFEASLDLAYAADAVICDYNYIFDPRVSLKRLLEEQKKSTVLLIDEAHNLVDRGREMFSASLNKDNFLFVKKMSKDENQGLYKLSSKINSAFIRWKKAYHPAKEFVVEELDEEIIVLLNEFSTLASQVLLETKLIPNHEKLLLDAYFSTQRFLKISEFFDHYYVIFGETNGNDVSIKLFCVNPAKLLEKFGKGYRAKIFFSATLTPLPFYKEILGGAEQDYQMAIPSPFFKEQIDVCIKPVSTRFRDRERTKKQIAEMLDFLLQTRPGNYLVFFPSYQYLLEIFEAFKEFNDTADTLVQSVGMTEVEREAFLEAFKPGQTGTLLGFAVLGGIFSEGVDLYGDRLNGVIIIGVGLPQLCMERNLIKAHFDENGKNGYEYAYVFPGMNKVLQAGGRLIRSETDSGTIVLVDDRFLQEPYRSLLPLEWSDFRII